MPTFTPGPINTESICQQIGSLSEFSITTGEDFTLKTLEAERTIGHSSTKGWEVCLY